MARGAIVFELEERSAYNLGNTCWTVHEFVLWETDRLTSLLQRRYMMTWA